MVDQHGVPQQVTQKSFDRDDQKNVWPPGKRPYNSPLSSTDGLPDGPQEDVVIDDGQWGAAADGDTSLYPWDESVTDAEDDQETTPASTNQAGPLNEADFLSFYDSLDLDKGHEPGDNIDPYDGPG